MNIEKWGKIKICGVHKFSVILIYITLNIVFYIYIYIYIYFKIVLTYDVCFLW